MSLLLWTIGHSTRPIEELLALIEMHEISRLVDVRLIPFSRRNPQFNTQALAESLAKASLHYHHLPALGGRRKARPDSINQGWRSVGFRGYADYMQTAEFWGALDELMTYGRADIILTRPPRSRRDAPLPGHRHHVRGGRSVAMPPPADCGRTGRSRLDSPPHPVGRKCGGSFPHALCPARS